MTCGWQPFLSIEDLIFLVLVNRDWMDGPMSNIDPDHVEVEVGNMWRALYKLEKAFDGIASPKKIAAKVHFAVCDRNEVFCG